MKPQNHTLRLIVSCAIVFSLAVTVVFIQEFKENEKGHFRSKTQSRTLFDQPAMVGENNYLSELSFTAFRITSLSAIRSRRINFPSPKSTISFKDFRLSFSLFTAKAEI